MSSIDVHKAPAVSQAEQDMGPLAWVLEELRKSLDGAVKSLRRFIYDAELAQDSDLAARDASSLRIARQQLHQASGALEMIGMPQPALVLRAMEAAVQRYVQQPELCTAEAAGALERASFALSEYLDAVLAGKSVSPVALFPQYRDIQTLAGADRIHPADLWSPQYRLNDLNDTALAPTQGIAPRAYGPEARSRLDQAVLKIVKGASLEAASDLRDLCLGFLAAQTEPSIRAFWSIAAGFFDGFAQAAFTTDVYVKRVASRVLMQYATLARGDSRINDQLVQDLLFFCSQAQVPASKKAPTLQAVRDAYALEQSLCVDYEVRRFGRFDPAVLAQARKRIATATETWSALAGGDRNKIKPAVDQFSLVCDSLRKLHRNSENLALALTRAVEATARSAEPPSAALAMEVATAVLYLQAAFEELDTPDEHMTRRANRLAERLDGVRGGAEPEPLELWMEELYRRVSDHQTMGSVVDELRATLGEAERAMDQFFRNPDNTSILAPVPAYMAQMRGVLSVLGLDQASLAVVRMRDTIERLLINEYKDPEQRNQVFEKLGNSLGALGFLIDMLSYQRTLARKLFVYDEALGELRILMGRSREPAPPAPAPVVVPIPVPVIEPPVVSAPAPTAIAEPFPELPAFPTLPEIIDTHDLPAPIEPPSAPLPPVVLVAKTEVDDELLEVFLEEAREVVGNGLVAVEALRESPGNLSEQTTLRRAFHTLKGSSRMVGLNDFGEAAWSMEQLHNAWLAEQKPMQPPLLQLAHDALIGFGRWVEDIARGGDLTVWRAGDFQASAEAMRAGGVVVPLVVPAQNENQNPQDQNLPTTFDFEAEEIDFSEFAAAVEASYVVPPEPTHIPLPPPPTDSPPPPLEWEWQWEPEPAPAPAPVPVPEPVLEQVPEFAAPPIAVVLEEEEPVKIIGDSLRIGVPLYNVYLGEADQWSSKLVASLEDWSQRLDEPLPDTAMVLAHSLAGSSATVGFMALSETARLLEHTLSHVQLQRQGEPEQARVFMAAAKDIRRLLHHFAQGLLEQPDPKIQEELRKILEADAPQILPPSPPEDAIAALVEIEEEKEEEEEEKQEIEAKTQGPVNNDISTPIAPQEIQAPFPPDHEEEIDVLDVIDPDLFPIFEEEAQELLPHLGASLRQWAARPAHLAARSEVLRALHTLKGSSRLAGAMRLGEMAHRLESAIEQLDTDTVQSAHIEPLLGRLDALQANFDALRTISEQAPPEASALTVLVHSQDTPAPSEEAPTPVRPLGAVPLAPLRPTAQQSVRVRAQLLDRLVNQAGEVMISRSRLESRLGQFKGSLADLSVNLDKLRHQLRDIEIQSESQMQSRLALTKDSSAGFDPLEFDRFTRVQELTRMMAESVNDVATVQRNLQRTMDGAEDDLIVQGRQARELQRDLLRTRMVEFEAISERLYAVVRQASKETGKQIKLDIKGGSIEMDRGVLDRMTPAFEHLLRNCVAHGIEDPAARTAVGKSPIGTITVDLHHEGNDVSVEFGDDGAGLHLERIRAKAIEQGLITPETPLKDTEAANLIFMPGFTTAATITGLAGRGIGMDVVQSEIKALGGRIETTTHAGQGTAFRMVLPLTTAVTQVVMLRAGTLAFGVPASLVEVVRRTPLIDIEQAYRNTTLEVAGESVPFYWAGGLLQISHRSTEAVGKTRPVVVFRSASQRIAMHVDEILGNQEVVVKNLGPQLARLPGLAGMSVLASGAVVLIYNPVALATVYGQQARAEADAALESALLLQAGAGTGSGGNAGSGVNDLSLAGIPHVPLVLVVDDSITVRRVTQRLLQREGYRVALASDGLQALECLRKERPAVVLSDIEMPRMDGFDLARSIRADTVLHDLPIIMITSRIAQKHQEHAIELGVNHYLGKPYSDEHLLSLVQHYAHISGKTI